MKDSSGNEITYIDISGEDNQRKAASNLCSDCDAILQRVLELENGAEKKPIRKLGGVRWKPTDLDYDAPIHEDGQKFEDSSVFLELAEDNSMPHKSDREELRTSSQRGCIMCTWLVQSLSSRSKRTKGSIMEQWLKRPATVERSPIKSFGSNPCSEHYTLALRCPAPPALPFEDVPFEGDLHEAKNVRNGITTQVSVNRPWPYDTLREDELATLFIDSMPSSFISQKLLESVINLEQEAPSVASLDMFSLWLDMCDDNHPECKIHTASKAHYIPARLINIRSTGAVRVVETSSIAAEIRAASFKYATLSHCWGAVHEPQLNKATENILKQGISVDKLPRLYHDAIILARHLKIYYLWIDSLCILQDSVDDWRHESTKMGDIYENSYICIAATQAPDNNSGLLERQRVDWPRPLVHGNLVVCADVEVGSSFSNSSRPGWCNRILALTEGVVDNSVLNRRAWVLQERMLSPRILHCTAGEFVWECRRGMRSESHILLTSGGSVTKEAWSQIHEVAPILKRPSERHLHSEQRRQYLELWSEIIGRFSSFDISFPQDRLPACSAIAKRLQPILGEYAAGLWERFMPSQLLWHHACFPGCERKNSLRQNNSPSWSWSSLDCKVVLTRYWDATYNMFPSMDKMSYTPLGDSKAITMVKILKTEVKLSGNDETGAVEGGRIDLSGLVLPLYRSSAFRYTLTPEPEPEDPNFNLRLQFDDGDPHVFEEDIALRRHITAELSDPRFGRFMPSYENMVRGRQKLVEHHSPKLTKMCWLPIISISKPSVRSIPKQKHPVTTTVHGLIIEHVEGSTGVYRRVGTLTFNLEVLEDNTTTRLNAATPLSDIWPPRLGYNANEGFTIAII
ncbi:HET-domain-containing protein [Trichoderma asperelloides]|nr:HET-domain-containing protein [Trichoderma asperelloides]